jgi:hypothetical protein
MTVDVSAILPLKIMKFDRDSVHTRPGNDESFGIDFILNRHPNEVEVAAIQRSWQHDDAPETRNLTHRMPLDISRNIIRVSATTEALVGGLHRDMLIRAVEHANEVRADKDREARERAAEQSSKDEAYRKRIDKALDEISFD